MNFRAFTKVSIRLGIVGAGAPWSKRYPRRSAYIFSNDTAVGRGGVSKVGGSLLIFIEAGCKLHEGAKWSEVAQYMPNRLTGA